MIYPIELSRLYAPYREEYVEAFRDFLAQGRFIGGPLVAEFEQEATEKIGAEYVVGCGNGTQAIELALRACGIGPGSEVITQANTYYATARAIVDAGATPVFCDIDENGRMDAAQIPHLITPRTRAIVPVHLYGIPAPLEALRQICSAHGLLLIEDCAHAFGSKLDGRPIGSGSFCACFSLYPTKNLGAMGDAGMVATCSPELAERMRSMRYLACSEERETFGANHMHARLDPVQAALLRVSLRHVDEWNAMRVANSRHYISRFRGCVTYIPAMEAEGVVPYVFPVLVHRQDDFQDFLRANGICPQIHYRPELHLIPHLNPAAVSLPKAEHWNRSVVSIPVSQTVSPSEIDRIADAVCSYFERKENRHV